MVLGVISGGIDPVPTKGTTFMTGNDRAVHLDGGITIKAALVLSVRGFHHRVKGCGRDRGLGIQIGVKAPRILVRRGQLTVWRKRVHAKV